MGLRNLIEQGDKNFRKELGDYYIISKSRMENVINVIETQSKHIKELTKTIEEQQDNLLLFEKELLKDGVSIPLEDE